MSGKRSLTNDDDGEFDQNNVPDTFGMEFKDREYWSAMNAANGGENEEQINSFDRWNETSSFSYNENFTSNDLDRDADNRNVRASPERFVRLTEASQATNSDANAQYETAPEEMQSTKNEGSESAPKRAGIGPTDRSRLNETEITSINQDEAQRKLEAQNKTVSNWLENPAVSLTTSDPFEPRSREGSALPDSKHRELHIQTSGSGSGSASEQRPTESSQTASDGGYIASPDNIDDSRNTSIVASSSNKRESSQDQSSEAPRGSLASDQTVMRRPWYDSPLERGYSTWRGQPTTSNAAMMRFEQRAKDIETASIAATLGSLHSRRRSEPDLNSLFGDGMSIRVPTTQIEPVQNESAAAKERRPGLLDRIVPRRSSSNVKKRKEEALSRTTSETTPEERRKDSHGSLTTTTSNTVKRMSDFVHRNIPITDTHVNKSPPPQSPTGSTNLSPPGNWTVAAKNMMQRARSRSDLRKSNPGLAELWAPHGGPPLISLKGGKEEFTAEDMQTVNPAAAATNQAGLGIAPGELGANLGYGDDILQDLHSADEVDLEEDENNAVFPGLSVPSEVQSVPQGSSREEISEHVRTTFPGLPAYMLQRIVQEQENRLRRCTEMRDHHLADARARKCPSSSLCIASGGSPKYLGAQNTGKGGTGSSSIYHVGATEADLDSGELDNSNAATFPHGIPLPPVAQLPAKFECSICFDVLDVKKPSDWTKHVHEDVQPFTCTFDNCTAKSFKRKADWVRHEKESHRFLERWTCNQEDCQHIVYRKDNFVQHLVRQHKLPDPRTRPKRANGAANAGEDVVTRLVRECRTDSDTLAKESCMFCGQRYVSWKKLTTCLATHMAQISLPILKLVDTSLVMYGSSNHQQQASYQFRGKLVPNEATRSPLPNLPGTSTLQRDWSDTGITVGTSASHNTSHPHQSFQATPTPSMAQPVPLTPDAYDHTPHMSNMNLTNADALNLHAQFQNLTLPDGSGLGQAQSQQAMDESQYGFLGLASHDQLEAHLSNEYLAAHNASMPYANDARLQAMASASSSQTYPPPWTTSTGALTVQGAMQLQQQQHHHHQPQQMLTNPYYGQETFSASPPETQPSTFAPLDQNKMSYDQLQTFYGAQSAAQYQNGYPGYDETGQGAQMNDAGFGENSFVGAHGEQGADPQQLSYFGNAGQYATGFNM